MAHKYIVQSNNELQDIKLSDDIYIIETTSKVESFNDTLEKNNTKEAVSLRDLLNLWNQVNGTKW